MKKIIATFLLIFSTITYAKDPSWIGYNITNKTDYGLNIQVHYTEPCDAKKDPKCTGAYGYVLLVPPNKTVVNKKDTMSYECFDNIHENAFIIEVLNGNGITIPTRILKNPEPKDYTITIEKNIIEIK